MVLALLRCSTRIGPCSVTSGVVLQHWASGNSEPWESCRTLEEMRKEMDEGKKNHGYTAGLSCSIFDDSPKLPH